MPRKSRESCEEAITGEIAPHERLPLYNLVIKHAHLPPEVRKAIAKLPKKPRGKNAVVVNFKLGGQRLTFTHGAEDTHHVAAAHSVVAAIIKHGLVAARHESKYPLAERMHLIEFISVCGGNLRLK